MKFQKGVPKIGGRQKGTPNRLTTTFREAVILAFDRIGGHQAFAQWAADNPTEFYRIASRLIPAEMGAKDEKIIVIVNRAGGEVVPVVVQRPALEEHTTPDGDGREES
jgi:hypothetical protein